MTESEWLDCTNPTPMLEFLGGKASDRKLRLFGVACCRRLWRLMGEPIAPKMVDVAEEFSEGKVTVWKLKGLRSQVASRLRGFSEWVSDRALVALLDDYAFIAARDTMC